MRKGFNGLFGLVRDRLQCDPLSGHVFLFCNGQRNRLKLVFWDGSGLWVCAKRLEEGKFRWPEVGDEQSKVQLSHEELALLLGGIDLRQTKKSRLAVAHRRTCRTAGFHESFATLVRTARFRPLSVATSGARGSGSGRICTDRAQCGQRSGCRGVPGATHRLPRHRAYRRGCVGGERHTVGSGGIRATGPGGRSGGTPAS